MMFMRTPRVIRDAHPPFKTNIRDHADEIVTLPLWLINRHCLSALTLSAIALPNPACALRSPHADHCVRFSSPCFTSLTGIGPSFPLIVLPQHALVSSRHSFVSRGIRFPAANSSVVFDCSRLWQYPQRSQYLLLTCRLADDRVAQSAQAVNRFCAITLLWNCQNEICDQASVRASLVPRRESLAEKRESEN